MQSNIDKVKNYLLDLQNRNCELLEEQESLAKFQEDEWQRTEGGGGRTRILQNGAVFEQVVFSVEAINENAVNRILWLKNRAVDKGLILLVANIDAMQQHTQILSEAQTQQIASTENTTIIIVIKK